MAERRESAASSLAQRIASGQDHIAAAELAELPAGRTILVYSKGIALAAQTALLLHLTGPDAVALPGGYNYCQACLHDPEAAGIAEMEPAQRKRYQAVFC